MQIKINDISIESSGLLQEPKSILIKKEDKLKHLPEYKALFGDE